MPGAEITEIACVAWTAGKTELLLHEKVKPKHTKPDARYNKSYDEKAWAKADTWDVQASAAVCELLAGHYICGSNPDFDKRMITAECFRTGYEAPRWNHRGVNTSTLGFPLYLIGETEQTGLEHLAKYFGIKHEAHTALGDCMAAIGVWEAFFDMYIYRPKMMREALFELKTKLETSKVYEEPGHALGIVTKGLAG
jgi:DNA polymerase III epsilon subunit-like protein